MAYFNALLQHQGPLTHVNHMHRVATTGSNYYFAMMEAKALGEAASKLFTGQGGPFGQWPKVEQAMMAIMRRVGDPEYLTHLRSKADYDNGLAFVVAFILVQRSEPIWYDMQKTTVQFMFYTADKAALLKANEAGNFDREPAKMLTSKLARFQNFALSRNDGEAANMAAQLLGRMR